MEAKKMIGKTVKYKDYDGKIIIGVIQSIGFKSKSESVIWYRVQFKNKQFLVPKKEIIL